MQIGVDACCWLNKRGFGRFTRELLCALVALDRENDYIFFVDRDTATKATLPTTVEVSIAPTHISPIEAASAEGRRSLRDIWALTRQVRDYTLDLFFFPAVYSYFPILNRTKVVLTIHDMIPDLHPSEVFPNRRLRFFWQLKQWIALRQTDRVLTVSEHSKRQISDICKILPSLIGVVSEAPGENFSLLPKDDSTFSLLGRYGIEKEQRFLLYVGGISPHKNLGGLVQAFSYLKEDPANKDVILLLVGDYQGDSFFSDYGRLKQQIHQSGLTDQIIFTGFISDQELAVLYNASSLLVSPSFLEGFGLPAIEAMACGVPVAASRTGSLPEVLGEAGEFFDPYNPQDIRRVIQKILSHTDLAQNMREQGLRRAKTFSWDIAARETLSVFQQTVNA